MNPGEGCDFSVSFIPSEVGEFSSSLELTDNVLNKPGTTQNIAFSGTGQLPFLSASPSQLSFGSIFKGEQKSLTLTVTNNNLFTQFLTVSTNSTSYTATPLNVCVIGQGGSCTIEVTFSPKSLGEQDATLTVDGQLPGTLGSPPPYAIVTVPLTGYAFPAVTPGATITCASGFTNPAPGLVFNGGAAIKGTALQLTDGGKYEDRSVFFSTPVGVASFNTQFAFQQEGEADGFTFVLQGDGLDALGTTGEGLSYGADAPFNPSIPNSIAIKFDLHNNEGEGTSSTGLYVNGATPTMPSINLLPSGIDLHSGHIFEAALSYDGTTLTVTITDQTTNAAFSQAFPIDIPAILGGPTGFAGFTAATGESVAVQNIIDWQLTSSTCCTSGEPSFADGFPCATGLTLNYGAAVSGGALQLTNDTKSEATSAYYSSAVPVNKFTSDFDFQFNGGSGDGFAFVLQSEGLHAVGGGGGGLGYGPDMPGGAGPKITKSVAVKFDLHNNAGEGPNSTGVYVNGASPTVPATDLTPSGINLHLAETFHARLSYDGANLTVSITSLGGYAVFNQVYPVDIPAAVGGSTAYAGFTAGTGAAVDTVRILDWSMTSY